MYNSISYRGTVDVTVNKRTHVESQRYRNSGTRQLGYVLSKALAGKQITSEEVPSYIDIRVGGETILYSKRGISSPYFVQSSLPDDVIGSTQYSVLLRGADIAAKVNDSSIVQIVLFDALERELAVITTDDSFNTALNNLRSDMTQSAVVKWSLDIVNDTEVTQ